MHESLAHDQFVFVLSLPATLCYACGIEFVIFCRFDSGRYSQSADQVYGGRVGSFVTDGLLWRTTNVASCDRNNLAYHYWWWWFCVMSFFVWFHLFFKCMFLSVCTSVNILTRRIDQLQTADVVSFRPPLATLAKSQGMVRQCCLYSTPGEVGSSRLWV